MIDSVPGIGLVIATAKRVVKDCRGDIGNLEFDDLLQAGWIALDKVRSRPEFDATQSGAATYMCTAIRQSLLRLIRVNRGPVRLPHDDRTVVRPESRKKIYNARFARRVPTGLSTPDFVPDLIDRLDTADTAARLPDALAELTAWERESLRLYYEEGLDDTQIAARRGCCRQAAHSTRHRALRKIHEQFAA